MRAIYRQRCDDPLSPRAPVHHEAAGDGSGGGQCRRYRPVRPAAAAQQHAARGRADGGPEHGPATDGMTPQVRDPLLVLLDERTVRPGLAR
jgi:hypothetical protein